MISYCLVDSKSENFDFVSTKTGQIPQRFAWYPLDLPATLGGNPMWLKKKIPQKLHFTNNIVWKFIFLKKQFLFSGLNASHV